MSEESLDTRLSVHEAVCAERYQAIEKQLDDGGKRMTKIEYLIYITLAAILLGPGVAAEFVKKLLGI